MLRMVHKSCAKIKTGSALVFLLFFCSLVQFTNAGFLDSLFGGDSSEKKKPRVDANRAPSGEGGAPDPKKPVSEEKGLEYLQQFGYMEPGKLSASGMAGSVVEGVVESAIKRFQEFAGLPRTGVMDVRTRKKMAIPRCGMLDVQNIGGVAKWKKQHLTYYISSYSPDLPRQQQNEAIRRAYALWSEQVPLDFSETTDISSADIKIKFASGSHGDPWPFDGRGGVLAHATFPTSGMLHFDESENWVYMDASKIATSRYTDLYPVAIHEIGHTLGLDHSKAETAIMAPFYQETVDSSGRYVMPSLKSDDIRAAQEIYGSRGGGRRTSGSSRPSSGGQTRPSSGWGSSFGGGGSDRDRGRSGSGNLDPSAGFGSGRRSGGRDRWSANDWPSVDRDRNRERTTRPTPSRDRDQDDDSGGFLSGLLNKWKGLGW